MLNNRLANRKLPMAHGMEDVPWNRLARVSVGFPVVGIGTKKALLVSSGSTLYFSLSPKLRLPTLPAPMLFLLPLRRTLPFLFSDPFFFRVLARDGVTEREWEA